MIARCKITILGRILHIYMGKLSANKNSTHMMLSLFALSTYMGFCKGIAIR